ncbi:UDP-glucose dehydrogenase family protein [Candidatus Riflebacteria bacterium]
MKITMIGTGYVGLVTGTCFASMGHRVLCFDKDSDKIESLKQGNIPIFEPGLEDLVKSALAEKTLIFSSDPNTAIKESEIIFIAVGTPSDESGACDLSSVRAVALEIGKLMNGPKIIINKSTVPVGTGEMVEKIISEQLQKENKDYEFAVLSNPEFLKEGSAVNDFMKPDRVVVGGKEKWALEKVEKLYSSFLRTHHPIFIMDRASAELSKYAANTMLAARISLVNELANLSEKVGANIDLVRQAVGSDQRIGKLFLFPGVGFGGSCFPKDLRAVQNTGLENDCRMSVLEAVEQVNNRQKLRLVEKALSYFNENLKDKKFAIWGLSFKPNTDDVREAPSLVIIKNLLDRGATVSAFDPYAIKNFASIFGNHPSLTYGKRGREVIDGCDALFILTEWGVFRNPPFDDMKSRMKHPVIFDGRNLYEPMEMQKHGFIYFSIGRNAVFQND